MNYKWTYDELTPEESARAALLAKEVAIHPALGSLLVRRGITTPAEARRFFRPQLSELHDPFLMNDMQAAVDRLNDALGRKERILVRLLSDIYILIDFCHYKGWFLLFFLHWYRLALCKRNQFFRFHGNICIQ